MTNGGRPRVLAPQRNQVEWRTVHIDGLIGPDHRARILWAVVEKLDLAAFYAAIRARGDQPGRPATDPKVLLALWLYATTTASAARASSSGSAAWTMPTAGSAAA